MPDGLAKVFADTLDGYLSVLNLSLDQKLQERKEIMLQKKKDDAKTLVMVVVGVVIVGVVILLLMGIR